MLSLLTLLSAVLTVTVALAACSGGGSDSENAFALESSDAGGQTPRAVSPTPAQSSDSAGDSDSPVTETRAPVMPFTKVAASAVSEGPDNWNDRPGVAVFGFDGDGHWLTLRLKGRMGMDGTGSKDDGIGAREFFTAESGAGVVQVREVYAGGSYLSQNSIDFEFGLGPDDLVGEIHILWPGGIEQTLTDVAADQVLQIEEPLV